MTVLKRCDQCQRDSTDIEPGWRRVEYAGDTIRLGDDPASYDFCSWRCVADFAQHRAVNEPQPRSPRPLDASAP